MKHKTIRRKQKIFIMIREISSKISNKMLMYQNKNILVLLRRSCC